MSSVNRLALASLLSALLTVLSFCIGFAPIPMTALICYPSALLGGLASMLIGWMSLRQIKSIGGEGRWMALTGLWVGGLSILAVICFLTLTLTLFPFLLKGMEQGWQSIQQWFSDVKG